MGSSSSLLPNASNALANPPLPGAHLECAWKGRVTGYGGTPHPITFPSPNSSTLLMQSLGYRRWTPRWNRGSTCCFHPLAPVHVAAVVSTLLCGTAPPAISPCTGEGVHYLGLSVAHTSAAIDIARWTGFRVSPTRLLAIVSTGSACCCTSWIGNARSRMQSEGFSVPFASVVAWSVGLSAGGAPLRRLHLASRNCVSNPGRESNNCGASCMRLPASYGLRRHTQV